MFAATGRTATELAWQDYADLFRELSGEFAHKAKFFFDRDSTECSLSA